MESIWNKSKNDSLDPLSVIIKMYIYLYKPTGSKISIHNNSMEIQDAGWFQGATRTYKQDSKNDITILNMPILFACNTYLMGDNRDRFQQLFQKAAIAFGKLKETYPGDEIIYSIDQLKNNIEAFNCSDTETGTVNNAGSYDSAGGKIKQEIYKSINSIWTEERLTIVFNYISELEKTTVDELRNLLIISFYSYMSFIDSLVHSVISGLS
jgi:hypothetical protein